MKNKTLIQLWVAFKIWIMAVAINSVCGALYLTGFNITAGLKEYFLIGSVFSLIFSFPIFLLLFFIIKTCVGRNMHPRKIFKYIFFTGIISTIIVFWLFSYSLGIGEIASPLFLSALVSCMISIGSQYRSMMRLIGKNEMMIENFLK
jgi:drug/metabolite transporter (DMT)-like permease